MDHRQAQNAQKTGVKYMLAGGSVVAALGLLVDLQGVWPGMQRAANSQESCQRVVQEKAVLSRDRLSALLAIPENSSRDAVRQVMQEPFCQLPGLEVRTGVTAEREAYPLEFDPNTWLVVLYEGDRYAGYAFSFRR